MTENQTNTTKGGGFLTSLLFVAFLVMKLTGVIDWKWIWVFSPLWIPLAFVIFILIVVVIVAIAIKHY